MKFANVGKAAVAVFALAMPAAALADYPEKPVTVVVPNKAGGGLDVVVRIMTEKLSEEMGQPFVVVNKPGAGTSIGSRDVNAAKADGYTILVNHEALLTLSAMGRLGFEVDNLEPVAKTGGFANFIAAGKDTPYNSLEELCTYAQANPGDVTAVAQIGALSHFHVLSVEAACDADFNIVNATGGGAGFRSGLLGGTYDLATMSAPATRGMAKSGDVKVFGYMATARHPEMLDTPTTAEQGYDTVEGDFNFYWWVPKGVPADVKEKLAEGLKSAFEAEDVQSKMADVVSRIEEKKSSINSMAEAAGLAAK